MSGGPLLMFPCLLAMWTLVLTSWAVVGEVVFKIFQQKLSNLIIDLTLVSTGQESIVT